MNAIVRLYETEQQARDAARMLADVALPSATVLVPPQAAESAGAPGDAETPTRAGAAGAEAAVRAAVAEGHIPGSLIRACVESLEQGRSIVAVTPPFGRGEDALRAMGGARPLDPALLPTTSRRNPSPFSDFLGIPTLTRPRRRLREDVRTPPYSFSRTFGLRVLSDEPAPLSSLFGIPLLSRPKRPRSSSFGLSLLSRGATPLSSLFGMRTLTTRQRSRDSSFGLPLLSKDPTPLSSFLNLPVLTEEDDDERRD